jgi:hypothetical protein
VNVLWEDAGGIEETLAHLSPDGTPSGIQWLDHEWQYVDDGKLLRIGGSRP